MFPKFVHFDFTVFRLTSAPQPFVRHHNSSIVMANPRARPYGNTANTEHYLPQRPPSWLQPSIYTQPDFQSLNSSFDLLVMVNQQLRHHPLHTEPMPSQTYFQDQRAYNLLYRLRGDLILLDRLIDNLSQARRLLRFVTTGPGLPGQYRINPTASLSNSDLAILHDIPAGFPLPPGLSSRSPHFFTTYPTTRRSTPARTLDRPSTTNYPGNSHHHQHSHSGTLTIPGQALTPDGLAIATFNLQLTGGRRAFFDNYVTAALLTATVVFQVSQTFSASAKFCHVPLFPSLLHCLPVAPLACHFLSAAI